MDKQIEQKRELLADLCRRYRVARLGVFGSVLRDDLDTDRSDLDFLVEFQPLPPGTYADTYFDLKEALERLFQRPIDLVVESAIRNPFFLKSVQQTKHGLYAT